MTTALDCVKASLRSIRVIDADETPSASDSAAALFALNSLLGRMSAQPNTIYQSSEISHTLTPGDGEYTVGTGGDIAYAITKIEQAFIRDGNTDLPLTIYTESQYQGIPDKTTQGTPLILNYVRGSKVRLWPLPQTAQTLRLIALVPFTELALADTITYPAEYRDFIILSTARRVSLEYGRGLWTELHEAELREASNAVRAMNLSQSMSPLQFSMPGTRRGGDLYWWIRGLQS